MGVFRFDRPFEGKRMTQFDAKYAHYNKGMMFFNHSYSCKRHTKIIGLKERVGVFGVVTGWEFEPETVEKKYDFDDILISETPFPAHFVIKNLRNHKYGMLRNLQMNFGAQPVGLKIKDDGNGRRFMVAVLKWVANTRPAL